MTPKTVLVVDDDPINLLLTSRILQKYGCRVLMANSPKQAIELFRQYTQLIDILLSDVNMPEMNGYGLAEFLRSLNPQLPVIFMSAGQDKEAPKRNFSVLCKPFTFEDLIESVVAALHSYPMSVRDLESN
jgi:CheY-like chemotaxis protein